MPALAAVLSPVTSAKKLSGGAFTTHAERHPAPLSVAMDGIATMRSDFAKRAIALGCAGGAHRRTDPRGGEP